MLDSGCAKVVAVYSPAYLLSKMCKEEFSVAHLRQIKTGQQLLMGILLSDVDLPYRMQNLQYIDCRETDLKKLAAAAVQLLGT